MKIAFIVGQFPSLSETFILNQITGLMDRGHDVVIFAQGHGDTSRIHVDNIKYKLLNRTYYTPRVPKSRILRILKGSFLLLSNFHRGPMVLLRSLNVFKYGKKAASLKLLYLIIPFIRRECDYDIIHCHFGPIAVEGILMRDIGAIRGKLVAIFHGYDMSIYVKQHGNDVYNCIFEKCDLLLPISEQWKNRLIEFGCDENKILVHHMGVDCRILTFSPPTLREGEKIRILTIARLVVKKGVEYGIYAVAKLNRKYKNIQYDIVGNGSLRGFYNRLTAELKMEGTIHLLGWKDQQQVHDAIANSHIFLCPSVTSTDGDEEGIPLALMEAMAAGLPVVASRHSGIPELVQDGVSGFLVSERDVDALVEKLVQLIEHPGMWAKMGRAGRAFVEANYDIDKLNNRLVEIYQNLLDS